MRRILFALMVWTATVKSIRILPSARLGVPVANGNSSTKGTSEGPRRVPERHLAESSAINETDHLVTLLPKFKGQLSSSHYAGLIGLPLRNEKESILRGTVPLNPTSEGKGGRIFYWLFDCETAADDAPLLIWLNGGPGCSSMDGLFLENGPFQINADLEVHLREERWSKDANLLFIDQPIGTGLSSVGEEGIRHKEEEISTDFYIFLQKFLVLHSRFGKSGKTVPIYIFGESHGGRWIPNFVDFILEQNAKLPKHLLEVDVRGIGIGNGWIHPIVQYDCADFARGVGLISFRQMLSLKSDRGSCRKKLNDGVFNDSVCLAIMDSILAAVSKSGGKLLNYYNIQEYVGNVLNDFPPGKDYVEKYLNKDEVRMAIHASGNHNKYEECSNPVFNALSHLDGESTLGKVEKILRSGTPVILYHGQWDLICNHLSMERVIAELDWPGASEYENSKRYNWFLTGSPAFSEPAGFVSSGGNLTFVIIRNSGHMVPLDQPKAARELIHRFLNELAFDTSPQSLNPASGHVPSECDWSNITVNYTLPKCVDTNQEEESRNSRISSYAIAMIVAVCVGISVVSAIGGAVFSRRKLQGYHLASLTDATVISRPVAESTLVSQGLKKAHIKDDAVLDEDVSDHADDRSQTQPGIYGRGENMSAVL